MNCVLFAKMDQVFSEENKTLKKYWKFGKKYWKSQGILSVRKSGNPAWVVSIFYCICDVSVLNVRLKPINVNQDKVTQTF